MKILSAVRNQEAFASRRLPIYVLQLCYFHSVVWQVYGGRCNVSVGFIEGQLWEVPLYTTL